MTITPATPNLDIPHLQPNAAQPEVVVDAALDLVDAKITGEVTVVIDHTNAAVLTQDQQALGSIFFLTSGGSPGQSAAATVDFAAFGMGNFTVHNKTAFSATLQISGQSSTPPVLLAGIVGSFYSDGLNVVGVATGTTGGGGGIVAGLLASTNLLAGQVVNVFNSGGSAKMQKADATDETKPASGFVLAPVMSGASGVFYGGGQIITGLSGLTPGSVYYLDTTAGGLTDTPPSTSGNIIQEVGYALNATVLAFFPKGFVQL